MDHDVYLAGLFVTFFVLRAPVYHSIYSLIQMSSVKIIQVPNNQLYNFYFY